MEARFTLPAPTALDLHDSNVAERWKKFRLAWDNYYLATELNKKSQAVQVATLLTVIGEDARDVFSTFTDWANEGDHQKVGPVLEKFAEYCQPRKNVPFERFRFNRRIQEPGESYDQYRTALRKLADGCEFNQITPDEILRDRLIFGIQDSKVRERLLRASKLTLAKTDEACRAAESTTEQMKLVHQSQGENISAVNTSKESKGQNYTESNSFKSRGQVNECTNCGRRHDFKRRENCLAYGKTCNSCGKMNHFAAVCRGKRNKAEHQKSVRCVNDPDSDELAELFTSHDVSTVDLDDSQLVTVKLESGNWLRFQPDTGAQCNVIPLHLYKKASKDHKLKNVTQTNTRITAYGGAQVNIKGKVRLLVWRDNDRYSIECKLVDSNNVRPILGRKACLEMNIIQYTDNDEINKPKIGSAPVYTIANNDSKNSPISKEELIATYPKVFAEEAGQLEGEYNIRLDGSAKPTQHAPRRVPVALMRAPLQKELDKLTEQEIITPVTTPTAWVNSMVVVPKKNGQLRICLDPKELNQAIQREHYPLPTIEEIATRLHGAKVFTKLDVRHGFWHVSLDEESSYLTTFNTPFGRYRWKRMPFGIASAPEVFQRKMHELIEGLPSVEVVADDFVVVGYGETQQDADRDHDKNLKAFLELCQKRNVTLNSEKINLRQPEVTFIGHIATADGLRVDPEKVRAIVDMPCPTDKKGIQRLLGLVQYLSKFLPNLTELTKPLRDLTQQDTPWTWDTPQQTALDDVKQAVTTTPVLRYYNLKEEVTLQCDASQSGLGAALLQNGQPVAFASRALTPAETRYAQIEKELLAIVFACEKFETYIYGRDLVTVETDHKPLESIILKPLYAAPQRLQRMLLRLQKYSLHLRYTKGKDMFLADTLSRAFLPSNNTSTFVHGLETVDHRTLLPVSDTRWQQIQHASATDPVLQQLRETIHHGWPEQRSELPECLYPYFDIRDELTCQEELVFKGPRLVVPSSVRKELMSVIHASHNGIDACIRRARDSLFWPRMTTELKEFISKCDICMAYRTEQSKEPIIQHEFVARPWSKVGADLCQMDNRTLLVMVDYYSNYIEVARMTTTTSRAIIKEMKSVFSRHGIPDILVTDNGPQFASAEFATFAATWDFTHVTSSPHYPRSNGKAENAVKTVKRIFSKCKDSGQSEFLALLDWRNTPTEGIGTSPAQRLMGRRCRTLLPVAGTLLQPRNTTEADSQALIGVKRRQRYYYDKHTRPLAPITPGEKICMKLPSDKKWSTGICNRQLHPRSYEVEVDNTVYRRNRQQLLKTNQEPDDHDSQLGTEATLAPIPASPLPTTSPHGSPAAETSPQSTTRQSERVRRPPYWQKDYVPS